MGVGVGTGVGVNVGVGAGVAVGVGVGVGVGVAVGVGIGVGVGVSVGTGTGVAVGVGVGTIVGVGMGEGEGVGKRAGVSVGSAVPGPESASAPHAEMLTETRNARTTQASRIRFWIDHSTSTLGISIEPPPLGSHYTLNQRAARPQLSWAISASSSEKSYSRCLSRPWAMNHS